MKTCSYPFHSSCQRLCEYNVKFVIKHNNVNVELKIEDILYEAHFMLSQNLPS